MPRHDNTDTLSYPQVDAESREHADAAGWVYDAAFLPPEHMQRTREEAGVRCRRRRWCRAAVAPATELERPRAAAQGAGRREMQREREHHPCPLPQTTRHRHQFLSGGR